jgi:hypothetical protein
LDQSQVNSSKAYCEEAYGVHGIGFNWCEQVLIDDVLFHNPRTFLDETNCSIDFDPNYLHIYLLDDCPLACEGATGQANIVGGTRAYSEPNGTMAHELAHLLNLHHLEGCPSDLDPNWQLGDPLGVTSSSDFVTDTPIAPHHITDSQNNIIWPVYQIDDPNTGINESCFVDWSMSIGLQVGQNGIPICLNPNGSEQTFPPNYGFKLDANGSMFYDPIWETNIMTGFNQGECRGGIRNFTPGQASRMIDYLDGPHMNFVDNSNPGCPNQTELSVLNQSMLTAGIVISGEYLVEQNLSINSDVIFRDANLFVSSGVNITVTRNGRLECVGSNFDVFSACGDRWEGIVVEPSGEVDMETVTITNADLGMNIMSTEIDLNFVGFVNCLLGMSVNYNSTRDDIVTTDCNFYESPIEIRNSTIKMDGVKCHKSPITSISTTGSHRLFISIGEALGRPCFTNSNIETDNLDFFGLANCYFDLLSNINVLKGNRVDICWSLFDGTQFGPKINLVGNSDQSAGVENYKIYGNQFVSDEFLTAIQAGGISSEESIIRNNIFNGNFGDYDFDSGLDNFVEVSCNFSKNLRSTPFRTADGMQNQGSIDHPAGNQFFFTNPLQYDIDALSRFDYYFNILNRVFEEPVGDIVNIPSVQSDESVCMSEQEILDMGLWEPFIDIGCNLSPYEWHISLCICPAPPFPGPQPIEPIGGVNNGGHNHSNSVSQNTSAMVFYDRSDEVIEVNHFENNLRINVEEGTDNMEVRLMSISGKVVWISKLETNIIETNLSHLPAGIYILNIKNQDSSVNYNHIINHQK